MQVSNMYCHTIVVRPNYLDEYTHGELDELEGDPEALIF